MDLAQYAAMDRNPIQEQEYQKLLTASNIPFTLEGGKANVTGFGVGGNAYGDQARSFFSPQATQARALSKQQSDALSAQNAAAEAKQNDFIGRFRAAVSDLPSYSDLYSSTSQKYNLPGMLTEAQRQSNALQRLPDTEKNATRGFNVNSNQLQQIINDKTAKLAPQANQALNNYAQFANLVNQETGYGIQEQQKDLMPLQLEGSMLSDQLAREMTGFTQQQDNQLKSYLAALDSNTQLTLEQMREANALAQRKLDYDNAKTDMDKYITLSAGQTVFNPNTGQAVYQAPYKPTASSSSSGW